MINVGKLYIYDLPKAVYAAPQSVSDKLEKLKLIGRLEEQAPFVVLEVLSKNKTSSLAPFFIKVLTPTGLVGYLRFWEDEIIKEYNP